MIEDYPITIHFTVKNFPTYRIKKNNAGLFYETDGYKSPLYADAEDIIMLPGILDIIFSQVIGDSKSFQNEITALVNEIVHGHLRTFTINVNPQGQMFIINKKK